MSHYLETPLQPVASRKITKLQFIDRFTPDEQIAIYAAEATVPAIRAWLERLRAAVPDPGTDKAVDLDDTRTIDAVNGLAVAGFIGEGRPAEILA